MGNKHRVGPQWHCDLDGNRWQVTIGQPLGRCFGAAFLSKAWAGLGCDQLLDVFFLLQSTSRVSRFISRSVRFGAFIFFNELSCHFSLRC